MGGRSLVMVVVVVDAFANQSRQMVVIVACCTIEVIAVAFVVAAVFVAADPSGKGYRWPQLSPKPRFGLRATSSRFWSGRPAGPQSLARSGR